MAALSIRNMVDPTRKQAPPPPILLTY